MGAICWGVIVVQSAVEQRSPGTEALQLQCARIVELQSANSGYLLKDEEVLVFTTDAGKMALGSVMEG